MVISIPHFGWWLTGCVLLIGLTSFVMARQSKQFYTMSHGVRQRFSIIDLELPSSAQELTGLLRGIGEQPEADCLAVRSAVRGQLWVDFLFMPGIYCAIFLLCMKAAQLLDWLPGRSFFAVLAWAQLLAWGFDIAENLTLFSQLAHPTNTLGPTQFTAYITIVSAKWILALAGGVCALSILFYYWVAG